MSEWTTLSVRKETAERFNETKSGKGPGEEPPADRFLNMLIDSWEDTTPPKDEREEMLEELYKALEGGQQSGPVELDATEYTKIADEIVGRLR